MWSEAGDDRPVYLVVIDNLRLDQWKMIEPLLLNRFRVAHNETYFSMLPTATQYARMPSSRGFPQRKCAGLPAILDRGRRGGEQE